MAFTIPNAVDATALGYPDLARIDKVDLDIIAAGGRGNGIVSGCVLTSTGAANGSTNVTGGYIRFGDAQKLVPATVVAHAANATGNPRYDLVTIPFSTGVPTVTAGTAAASPVFPNVPAGSVVVGLVRIPNGHTSGTTIPTATIVDKGITVPRFPLQTPDFWTVYGHSFVMYNGGSIDQTGRLDSVMRGTFDIEHNNWRNHGKNGAILWYSGGGKGNWSTIWENRGAYQNLTAGPYPGEGGATLLCFGINDLGTIDPTTQIQTAISNAFLAAISRCRSGVVYKGALAGRTVFGAGFAQVTNDFDNGSLGGTYYNATAITNANITMTLPADYQGEPVSMCFLGSYAGAGLITFSGTAGVTGTLELASDTPGASFSYSPMIFRVTNLTSAQAGLTIVATVTRFDAGTSVKFTDWWLESLSPPPVLVCNINRPTAAGYALYGAWTGTQASKDAQVATANANLAAVVAQFDPMVQIVDMDSVIGNSTALTSDGLHPNDLGAELIADQIVIALQKIFPISSRGQTASMNTPAPRSGNERAPHMRTKWYTTRSRKGYGTSAAVVAGDMYMMPLVITEAREQWGAVGVNAINAVAGTAVRLGMYDDPAWTGYPQKLAVGGEFTSAGALTVLTATGMTTLTIPFPQPRTDPGLYWQTVKFTTAGAAHTFACLLGPVDQMTNLGSTGLAATPAGYKLTGQGTGAFPDKCPTGASEVDSVPYVAMQLLSN